MRGEERGGRERRGRERGINLTFLLLYPVSSAASGITKISSLRGRFLTIVYEI